jgi:hypothetical protein
MSETRIGTGNERTNGTTRRSATETLARWRELASLALGLAGLAAWVLCLAHLGWWMAGFTLATLALCVSVAGIMHRDGQRDGGDLEQVDIDVQMAPLDDQWQQ